jgi:multiple sugar transport system substrate-binding protein
LQRIAARRPADVTSSTHGTARRVALLATSAVLAVAVVAPGGTVAQDKTVITQWYHQYGEAGTQEAAQRYAQEYMAANPDVQVNVEWVPGDYFTKLGAALLTDSGPDLYETTVAAPEAVANNQLADLSAMLTPDVQAQFDPRSFKAFTVDGKPYAVPFIGDIGLMYYRKSMFDEAGIPIPQTWEDFVSAAKALTKDQVKGAFFGNDGGVAQAYIAAHAAGHEMITDDKIAYNNADVSGALQQFQQMTNDGSVLLGAPTEWYDPTVFISGLAATQWGGLWMMPAVEAALGDDFVVGPWPAAGPNGKCATFFSQWASAVNGKSPNADAAKAYTDWLWLQNDADQQDFNLSYGFHLPPRLEIQQTAEPLKTGQPAEAVQILADCGFVDSVYYSGAVSTPYVDAVSNILKNGADPASELDKAATVAQEELDKLLGK